jgi:hypothetical protein
MTAQNFLTDSAKCSVFLGAKRRESIKAKAAATDKSIVFFSRIFSAELKFVRLG